MIFLDSVDQITGAVDANRMSWIPTRLPPNVKVSGCVTSKTVIVKARKLWLPNFVTFITKANCGDFSEPNLLV